MHTLHKPEDAKNRPERPHMEPELTAAPPWWDLLQEDGSTGKLGAAGSG